VLYGAQTQRALAKFPISGWPMPARLIAAIARLKRDTATSPAVIAACDEIIAGKHAREFPVDVFQDGSGKATITNVNEVIEAIAGVPVEPGYELFEQAIHLTVREAIRDELPALGEMGLEDAGRTLKDMARELASQADDSEIGESVRQVCRWVLGANLTVEPGALPVVAAQLLESVHLLANAAGALTRAGIHGKGES